MLRALTHAVVHVVALGRDDPLVPLDVLEFDVEVSLAAHGYLVTAAQRALPHRVFRVVVPETHLGHQEGPVGAVGAIQGAQVLPVLFTADLQSQPPLAAVQEGLQGAGDGESVPIVLLDFEHLFDHQGAVGAREAAFRREEDPGEEAGVSVGVLGGAGIDPQR